MRAADVVRTNLANAVRRRLRREWTMEGVVLVMSKGYALKLSKMRNVFGQREFPEVTDKGGDFCGIPVVINARARTPFRLMRP